MRQNQFSPPPAGFHAHSWSWRDTIPNVPGAGCAFDDAAAPLRLWHRLLWQSLAGLSGAVASYLTAPRLQPLVGGRSIAVLSIGL